MSPTNLTRRQFLAGAAGVGALGAAGYALGAGPIGSLVSGSAATGRAPKGATLVLVTLYGGNDGLNTLIPYEDGNYLGQRGALAYQPNEVIPLSDGLALHPNLKGLKQLWDSHELAIVRGVGYPDPSFSHFRSMDIWQSAVSSTDVSTGWLGRWLDATGKDPLRALSIGPTLPLAFTGAKVNAAALPTGSLKLPGTAGEQALYADLETPFRSQPPELAAVAQSGGDLLRVQHTLSEILRTPSAAGGSTAFEGQPAGASAASTGHQNGAPAKSGGSAGAGALGDQLDSVAKLIKGGGPSKVYGVSLGGFDTHTNEKATQAALLSQVDAALTSFVGSLRDDPHGRGTVAVVYTEFGRRVAANASGGTDHGSAGPVFVVGPQVKGGFYGEEPSLTNLDMGNLRYTTDFRSIYATLLEEVIGVDSNVALGGGFPPVNFL